MLEPELASSRSILLDEAIDSAWEYLRREAGAGFPEARHEMTFPRAAGFTGPERQSSDIFPRAVLGGLLVDIATLDERSSSRATECRRLARREADYVASRKLAARRGGWSYFPGLPELPPDLDSLSAALALFARSAPEHLGLCAGPLAAALDGLAADGSLETWIVSSQDAESDRARMNWGISRCWGTGTDPDVVANFYHALAVAEPSRYRDALARGVRKVLSVQRTDGAWEGTWYAGVCYGTALGLQLLVALDAGREAADRARTYLARTQRADGGWGDPVPLPLETAVSIWALQLGARSPDPSAVAGSNWLLSIQNPDGSWFSSPWIQMPIGRPGGSVVRRATWESVTITTAFCMRSMVRMRGLYSSAPG